MPTQFFYLLSNALMLLAAIFGLVMVFLMRPPSPRLLAVFAIVLVLVHSALEWVLPEIRLEDLGIPPVVIEALSWASYVVLLVGLLLLVLAATKRSGLAMSAPSRGYAPYQPAPQQPPPAPQQPAAPPPMPPPGGTGPRP